MAARLAKFSAIHLTSQALLLPLVVGFWVKSPLLASAQIIEDATLPTNSIVNPAGATTTITGGTPIGSNLFHSFQQFSLPSGTAFFNNDVAIQNIIARVTGGIPSSLNGTLQANGTANLFLINPSGITFGPNARLNLGGSFLASTAQSIQFADGSQFSAVAPQSSLLTVTVPIGLQYGPNAAPITVQGAGSNVFFDPSTFTPQPNTNPGLQVVNGQTLAIVGGDVLLDGGNLLAPEGRIELGSVRSGGLVSLTPVASGWTLGYSGVSNFGDIRLVNKASADVSGNGGGSMQVQSRTLGISGGSTLFSLTQGDTPGQAIAIRATEAVEVTSTGVLADDVNAGTAYISAIATDTGAFSTANGGNLTIDTPLLRVLDGAQLSASVSGSARGGDFIINSQNIELVGGIPGLANSGLFVTANLGTGQGGDLTINTQRLVLLESAQVGASVFDAGNAGVLTVNAQTVTVDGVVDGLGPSGITSIANFGTGNSGQVRVNADQVQVTNGARIATTTFTDGQGGNVTINAKTVQVAGVGSDGRSSRIVADTGTDATGNGGQLVLNADRLQVSGGGSISTATYGAGNAGELSINAQTIQLTGEGETPTGSRASALTASAESGSTGDGGSLRIFTNALQVTDGAQIVTSTNGPGNSGNLTVNAQTIDLIGVGAAGRSGLFTSALESTGSGGDLLVNADRLTLQDGATINVSNFPSKNLTIPPGQGSVGNALINARLLRLENGATITAASNGGDKGNLAFQSDLIVLRQGSSISTNALGTATGGNIVIDTQFLVAPALENSDITANAVGNRGGRVTITAESIFGIAPRAFLTPQSDITASSDLGLAFSGEIEIRTPEGSPTQVAAKLPEGLNDNDLVTASCEPEKDNSFTITGRGGLPEDASQMLRGQSVWLDFRLAGAPSSRRSTAQPRAERIAARPPVAAPTPPTQIVEFQGWVVDAKGQVTLVAHAPHALDQNFGADRQFCGATPSALP